MNEDTIQLIGAYGGGALVPLLAIIYLIKALTDLFSTEAFKGLSARLGSTSLSNPNSPPAGTLPRLARKYLKKLVQAFLGDRAKNIAIIFLAISITLVNIGISTYGTDIYFTITDAGSVSNNEKFSYITNKMKLESHAADNETVCMERYISMMDVKSSGYSSTNLGPESNLSIEFKSAVYAYSMFYSDGLYNAIIETQIGMRKYLHEGSEFYPYLNYYAFYSKEPIDNILIRTKGTLGIKNILFYADKHHERNFDIKCIRNTP